MGPFARIVSRVITRFLSSAAIASLTLGSVALVASTPVAMAKSSNSNSNSNSGNGSHGNSGDKSHGQNGKALGKAKKAAASGPKPAFCTGGIDSAAGIDVYNYAVTAVAGAQDALQRAAARLDDGQIPGPAATATDAKTLIGQLEAQPWSWKTGSALKVLERQLDSLQARDDLSA